MFFLTGTPPKNSKYKKVNLGKVRCIWPIYVNVDSPNLGFPYFNFLGGYQLKKHPVGQNDEGTTQHSNFAPFLPAQLICLLSACLSRMKNQQQFMGKALEDLH